MKRVKILFKNIIIYIVIMMIVLSNFSTCCAAYTSEQVGNAVAGFAKHVLDTYGDPDIGGDGTVQYSQPQRTNNPIWNSNSSWNDSVKYFDCTSFACGCYNYVTGGELVKAPHATEALNSFPSDMKDSFERIKWNGNISELKVGDLMYYHVSGTDGHGWIFVGGDDEEKNTANDGHHYHPVRWYADKNTYIYRVKEDAAKSISSLNTQISTTGSAATAVSGSGIDYSKFFFNGIPDGKYSIAKRTNLLEMLIDLFENLLNYLVGLATYVIRLIIVSLVSIADRLLNNTIKSVTDAPITLQQSGVSSTSADDPKSENRAVTIESLVFNEMDLFDINIFRVEEENQDPDSGEGKKTVEKPNDQGNKPDNAATE